MNTITMKLQADHLIEEALKEDISSEDVTTNSVMKESVQGEVNLICKQDGIIAGLEVFKRVFELLDANTKIEFYKKRWRRSKKRRTSGCCYRRYPCTVIWRKSGTELSATHEWNCHIHEICCKIACRN